MGNSLRRTCLCLGAWAAVAASTAGATKKNKKDEGPAANNMLRAAPRRHAVVPVDKPEDGNGEKTTRKDWRTDECREEPAGGGEQATVRVTVVMTRKDAAELMARLEERAAAEREAGTGDLRAKLGGGTTSSSHGAWRPRLASIPET